MLDICLLGTGGEGMYGDDADSDKAVQKKHMTISEAAYIARQGRVKELF